MMLKLRNGFLREVRRGVRASRATADAQLRAAERACVLSDGAVARVDVAQLPANRPIEDFYASAKCISSNAFLFGSFPSIHGLLTFPLGIAPEYVPILIFDVLVACFLYRLLSIGRRN